MLSNNLNLIQLNDLYYKRNGIPIPDLEHSRIISVSKIKDINSLISLFRLRLTIYRQELEKDKSKNLSERNHILNKYQDMILSLEENKTKSIISFLVQNKNESISIYIDNNTNQIITDFVSVNESV